MDLKSKIQATVAASTKFGAPPSDNDGILDGPEDRQEPVQRREAVGQGSDFRLPKGSRRAPPRESSADKVDGRAARATGRNSRLNIALRPEHLDAFKEGSEGEGVSYCEIIEEMIEARWPKLVAQMARKYDEMYGRQSKTQRLT